MLVKLIHILGVMIASPPFLVLQYSITVNQYTKICSFITLLMDNFYFGIITNAAAMKILKFAW